MQIPKNQTLSLALSALGIAAAFYSMVNYVGPYRWLSELQTRILGFYLPAISLGVPALIFLIPGRLVEPEPGASEPEDFPTYEAEMIYRNRRLIRRLRFWAVGCAVGGILVFLFGLTRPDGLPAPVSVASSAPPPPPVGVPVLLRGIVDQDQVHSLSTHGVRLNSESYAAPLLGQNPVRYVVDLGHDEMEARWRLDQLTRQGQAEGTLRENGLSGEMRASFEGSGVRFADPYYLLEPDGPTPHRQLLGIAWLLLGVGAVLGLIIANAWRLIRLYRGRQEIPD
ncbi:MAG: hypothetical protein JO276_16245 [Sphingomonadaceae bacterium]|nr:hypothetical protein [Sphingomonadaceae bacterium]